MAPREGHPQVPAARRLRAGTAGATCVIYLDSNVFIYAALGGGKEGNWCRDLIRRVTQGEDEAVTSALAVDEVVYQVRVSRGLERSIPAGGAGPQMAHLTVRPPDAEMPRTNL